MLRLPKPLPAALPDNADGRPLIQRTFSRSRWLSDNCIAVRNAAQLQTGAQHGSDDVKFFTGSGKSPKKRLKKTFFAAYNQKDYVTDVFL